MELNIDTICNKYQLETTKLSQQIENYENGFPYLKLYAQANKENAGILSISQDNREKYIEFYNALRNKKVVKFVPASGASTRMFKNLLKFLNEFPTSEKKFDAFVHENNIENIKTFFDTLDQFAFYDDLKKELAKQDLRLSVLLKEKKFTQILQYLLTEEGLGYANSPKGLVKFHSYLDNERTAFEEHLVEGANYADKDGVIRLHYTVGKSHLENFKTYFEEKKEYYEKKLNVQFDISFSLQNPKSNVIAVDMDNEPFRKDDGEILFRPAGHGALLENLNNLDADVVFIKNIDNVVPDYLKEETIHYKKVLAGLLVELQTKTFTFLNQLDMGATEDQLLLIQLFVQKELSFKLPYEYAEWDDETKTDYLKTILNRPLRICGMVKNQGEPGGGPFWVKREDGSVQLQIVEQAQIDLNDPVTLKIFLKSTHFNPVDIVCGIKDYKRKPFELTNFVDHKTGFITRKSFQGRELKAQELPGLWNGSMADWISVFVEVPVSTFNPVKNVMDLLRTEHQPEKLYT